MLPSIDEAIKELEIAEKLNPGPWVKHSMNVGVAARSIVERIPGMDPTKAFIVGITIQSERQLARYLSKKL